MPTLIAAFAFVADVVTDTLIAVGVPGTIAVAAGTFAEVAAVVGTAAVFIDSAFARPTPEALRETFRQSIPPRRRGVGVARLGGAYLLDYATGQNDLFRVIAFCDGPVANISRYYLAQDVVTLSGTVVNRLANGAYNDNTSIWTQFGETGVQAFPSINSPVPQVWTSSCYGTGIFMGATAMFGGSLQKYTTNYPRGPAALNIVGEINTAYDWRVGGESQTNPATWANTVNPIVGLVNELVNFRGYDWATDIAPSLDLLTAAADDCDAQVTYLNVFAQAVIFTAAGSNNVILELSAPIPPNGATLYVGGQSFTVTGNSTVTVDGVTGRKITFSGGTLLAGVGIQAAVRWQATPTNPQTENKYACGGAWNADEAEADTVKRFVEACDGWMMRRGSDGALVIRDGQYYEPTVTLGPDEVISYTWQPDIEMAKVITQLTPAFVAPAFDYNQTDTTPWTADGPTIEKYGLASQPFRPDMVQSNGQVMRLAKRKLNRLLAHNEVITCKFSAWRAIGERYIRLQLGGTETADLQDIVVEVVGDIEIIDNGMAITIPIAPADPTIDAWDPYTDEGGGPSGVAPAAVVAPDAPTVTTVTPFGSPSGAGGLVGVRLALSVAPPTDFTTTEGLTWISQWQVTGSGDDWSQLTHTDQPSGSVSLNTAFVPADSSIDVQSAFQTGGGQRSPFSATTTVSTSTSAIAPDAPAALTAADLGVGVAFLQWRNPASANFDHARVFRAAHGAGFGAATDVSGPLAGVANAAQSYSDPSGAGNFDYWVVGENASNTASTPDGPANATVTAVPTGAAPAAPTLIATANLTSGEAWIGWTNPSSPTFHHARVWRATHGAGFGAATDVSGALAGTVGASQSTNDVAGAGSWDYWVTAENSSNVASTPDGPSHVVVT